MTTPTQTTARKTIDRIEVAGKRVLARVDFNVPLEDGVFKGDRRIRLTLPTLESVLQRGGRLILMSHLGRPAGVPDPKLSLEPVAKRLGELLPQAEVKFVAGPCDGPDAAAAVDGLGDGQILLLENLRFCPGELKGDAAFAGRLASLGDVYCNDAFGTSHRTDASMVAVPQAMAGRPRVAGLLLDNEIRHLQDILDNPQRPFVAVLGGAKVSDKLGAIRNLINRVDTVLVGGAMAYTFLKALGQNVGSSLVAQDKIAEAREIIDLAAASPTDAVFPTDHVCGKQLTTMTPFEVHEGNIPDGWMGLDIGPKSTAQFTRLIREAKTIIWNGPVGAFETKPFDVGTRQIATAISASKGVTVAGGGDTATAVEAFGLTDRFTHVSTGGGASLRLLEGRRLESLELIDQA